MIYAIRKSKDSHLRTLVEFKSVKALQSDIDSGTCNYWPIDAEGAHKWVRDGKEHETGLFINDDGEVEYAPAEGE